jgi:peptidyl-prolyl cis-trans isomerase D
MESGIINAIRSRSGWVVGFVFVSLVIFVLSTALPDLQSMFNNRDTSVGEVAGKKINLTDYDAILQKAIANAQQQSTQNLDEATRRQVADQVWQGLVEEKLMDSELASVGIDSSWVSPLEVKRLFRGPDESPVIRQYRELYDASGNLNTPLIDQFMFNAKSNPDAKAQYNAIKRQIVRQRVQEVYYNLLGAPIASEEEARRKYAEDRTGYSFQYLAVNFGAISDSTVTVTDADLKQAYDKQKARFQQDEDETEIKYVVFRKAPSREDSAAAASDIMNAANQLAESTDDSAFVVTNAFTFDTDLATFRPISALNPRLQELAKSKPAGTVVGPELVDNRYELTKVSAFRRDSLATIKARHLLIRPAGRTLLDTLRARIKADSIARVATDANFATLVAQLSEDPNSRFSGGDLGWIQRGQFGPAFDKAAGKLGKGVARKAIESPIGFHVLNVEDRDDRLVRVVALRRDIYASQGTINLIERKANVLASAIKTADDLTAEAEKLKADVRTSPALRPAMREIPGLTGAATVVNWALRSEVAEHTPTPLETEDAFVVAVVTEKVLKGNRPFDAVKEDLRPEVVNQKKAANIRAKLAPLVAQASGDLEKLRASYGEGAYVSRAENVFFGANSVPGLGNEPKLLGTVARLKADEVSEPIGGRSGVFVIKRLPTSADTTRPDAAQLDGIRTGIAESRRNQMRSKAYQGLREAANIKDRRYNFGQ